MLPHTSFCRLQWHYVCSHMKNRKYLRQKYTAPTKLYRVDTTHQYGPPIYGKLWKSYSCHGSSAYRVQLAESSRWLARKLRSIRRTNTVGIIAQKSRNAEPLTELSWLLMLAREELFHKNGPTYWNEFHKVTWSGSLPQSNCGSSVAHVQSFRQILWKSVE